MTGWTRKILVIATVYYVVLGLTAIFWPQSWYFIARLSPVNAEVIMGALGAAMLCLGFTALLSVFFARSQWTLVAVLIIANVLDLLVVSAEITHGQLGAFSGGLFFAIDLVWIVALGWVLQKIARLDSINTIPDIGLDSALSLRPDGSECSLAELSDEAPVLIVLIRHSGCTFCRAHLAELMKEHKALMDSGAKLVIVGMSDVDDLRSLLKDYPIPNAFILSDPTLMLYRGLGAKRGGFWKLLGPRELWHAIGKGQLFRYGLGEITGDPAQLGGTFVLKKRKVVFAKPAESASDSCPLPTALTAAH